MTSYASLGSEFNNQSQVEIGGLFVEVELIEQYALW